MISRTRYLAFGIVLALTMTLAACGGDDDDDTAVAAPAARAAAPAAPAAAPAARVPAPTAVAAPAVPAAMTGPQKKGGIFRLVPSATIGALDPVRNSAFVTRVAMNHAYDWPFGWNNDLVTQEQMIDTWSMTPDSLSYTFTLRDDLQFHDGTAVLASDVAATMHRWHTSIGTASTIWDLFGDPTIEVVDDKTYKVIGSKAFGLWVAYSGVAPIFVMPKSLADSLEPEEVNTNYIGSGPMKFVEWKPGAAVVYERYDAYVPRTDPKSGSAGARITYVDRVELIEISDAATRVAALQTKQVDMANGIPTDFFDQLSGMQDINVQILPNFAQRAIAQNKTTAPLTSDKALLALQWATDVEEVMRAAYGPEDLWVLCPAIFFCNSQWETDVGSEIYYGVDKAKAKTLWQEALAETGFDGKIVILTSPDYADLYASALVTKGYIEEMGSEVDFVVTDWATVISRKISNLDKDPSDGGWHYYESGCESCLDPIGSPFINDSWNGGWNNPRAQKLRADFANVTSSAEGMAIVEEIQRIFYEEGPAVVMYGYDNWLQPAQNYVKDYNLHKHVNTDGVWLDI